MNNPQKQVNLPAEFVRAIMISLKIEDNSFLVGTVKDYTKHVKQSDYKRFMSELFGTQHSFLNGLDRVAKVAEQFKPLVINQDEEKAKELIDLVHAMNNSVYHDHSRTGVKFEALLDEVSFPKVDSNDIRILNNVKPYYNLKLLIAGINCYATSIDKLNAFKQAIQTKGSLAIDNKVFKRLKISL